MELIKQRVYDTFGVTLTPGGAHFGANALKWTADYHVHSRYSDGHTTLLENVEAALSRGLDEIALTEHGPRHLRSGIKAKRIPEMIDAADSLKRRFSGRIVVKAGIEANLAGLDGSVDLPKAYEGAFEVIGLGFHRSALGRDARTNAYFFFTRHFQTRKRRAKRMTDLLISALEKNRISFLAHPGQHTGPLEWERLAKACAEHNVAIEISARKGHLCFSPEDAQAMQNCGAVFVVNSDAHRPDEVGSFDSLTEFLQKSGIDRSGHRKRAGI